ncbi:hypothetical protein BT69DRAFT_1287754, partial [Atractiella rhizophila]
MFSQKNVDTGKKFLTSYGKTWVGMSPVWLLGEAILPGQKVGTQFKKGSKELLEMAEELRKELATSTSDVIIILDEKFKSTNHESQRVAELLKAASNDAIVLVTSSIEKVRDQINTNSPALKRSIMKNSKDVIVLADKGLKNPIVITGVTKFARSQGVPYPEAIIRLASLALAKIVSGIDAELAKDIIEVTEEGLEAAQPSAGTAPKQQNSVHEVDAEALQRHSTQEAKKEAELLEKISEAQEKPPVKEDKGKTKKDSCVIA